MFILVPLVAGLVSLCVVLSMIFIWVTTKELGIWG